MNARRFASHYGHVRFALTTAGAVLLIAALAQGSGAQPAKKQPATGLEGHGAAVARLFSHLARESRRAAARTIGEPALATR